VTLIEKLTVGSLFSGIGGIELGLERTGGFETKWQCEIDPYAQAVLRKHWPNIPCYPDIRELGVSIIPERVDVLCGGFPCQDISTAGKRTGIHGERSGLFFEIVRLARILRPRYILLENVAALTIRGLDTVLGELAMCGYDAEWDCISAASVGALHRRDRLFIVAYRDTNIEYTFIKEQEMVKSGQSADPRGSGEGGYMAYPPNNRWARAGDPRPGRVGFEDDDKDASDAHGERLQERRRSEPTDAARNRTEHAGKDVPDAELAGTGHICRETGGQGREPTRALEPEALRQGNGETVPEGVASGCLPIPDASGHLRGTPWDDGPFSSHGGGPELSDYWATEPDVGRVAHGVPSRVDRLRCLGNAVVPQVAQYVGQCILDHEQARR